MNLPEGYDENQLVEIVSNISGRLANKFKFGYHEIEDMKQQVWLEILKPDQNGKNALDKYDSSKPLENYLWVHAHNRLYNFKRNNYARPEKPCDNCPLGAYINSKCTAFSNMSDCEHYFKWEQRNITKKSLMSTKPHQANSTKDHRNASGTENSLIQKETFEIIDSNIPINMREDWIRYTNKVKLPKSKRENLLSKIIQILEENGIDKETW